MNVLPWLPWAGWAWLLTIAAQGMYLTVDFFYGPWLYPLTAHPTPTPEGSMLGNAAAATTMGAIITLVVANSLFVAAARQLGEDKPAITRIALFISAAFVLAGEFIVLSEANPVLAATMLPVPATMVLLAIWASANMAYSLYGLVRLPAVFRTLWRRSRRE